MDLSRRRLVRVGPVPPKGAEAVKGVVTARHLTGSAAHTLAALLPHPVTVHAPLYPIAVATARAAASRLGTAQPRPAPFYLRGADAAPPSDPPPVILDAVP